MIPLLCGYLRTAGRSSTPMVSSGSLLLPAGMSSRSFSSSSCSIPSSSASNSSLTGEVEGVSHSFRAKMKHFVHNYTHQQFLIMIMIIMMTVHPPTLNVLHISYHDRLCGGMVCVWGGVMGGRDVCGGMV